jgi:hypothetical protein
MSFHRIDMLPAFDAEKRNRQRARWSEADDVRDKILDRIRAGAGEDFLQWDFEKGNLGPLEDQWDLAGFDLFNEELVFSGNDDNFENIDFSYSEFWHTTFSNATFFQAHFTFTKLYNVEFRNCLFSFAHFYGAKLERCRFINCDFVEENGFSNCDFVNSEFANCFFNKSKFSDCRFDENVRFSASGGKLILGLRVSPSSSFKEQLIKPEISKIFRNIKEAYHSGQVYAEVRKYVFLQHQAYTRFNRASRFGRAKAYAWEILAGYGVKPLRVLALLVFLFLLVFMRFAYISGGVRDGLLLSAGAFLTFGAKTELLTHMGMFDQLLYVSSAFAGVSLVALFITVMANLLLKET